MALDLAARPALAFPAMDMPHPQGTQAGLVTGLDHYNIRCRPDELDTLRDFYVDVLGLRPGPRPHFSFPGHWLYASDIPLVHIAAALPEANATPGPGSTGRFDHVSFLGADVARTQAHLDARGITWKGTDVPGFPLYQLFFHDPVGVKVEVTFRVGGGPA